MKKINIYDKKFFLLSYFLLTIIISLFAILAYDYSKMTYTTIVIYSWIVNFIFFISLFYIYILENKKIGIIFIILVFIFLFNFGQTFFWSLNIHFENEIGSIPLFDNFHTPTIKEIGNTILYSLCCLTYVVLGVLTVLCLKNKRKICNIKLDVSHNYIYTFSKYVSIYIIPATFIKIFLIIYQSLNNGYASLYYSDFQIHPIIANAENFFFPVILGLLIGKKFKNYKKIYFIFAVYTILYLIAGERGNWIYKFVTLFWLHYYYVKKINFKYLFYIGIIGIAFLYIVNFIIQIRGIGLMNMSFENVITAIKNSGNPIIGFIFEMGNSMGVTLIVLSLGQSAFAVGNTFLSSILASFSSRIASMLGVNAIFLANYLSQDILKINYGTGFNLFAEIFINGGYIGTIFYSILLGIIIALIFKNSCDINVRESPMKLLVISIISYIVFSMFRDSSLTPFKLILQTGIIYPVIMYICYYFSIKLKAISKD